MTLRRVDSGAIVNQRNRSKQFAGAMRWLHVYLSMFAFASLIFFGVTGVTLNHPDWFGADMERVSERQGTLDRKWLGEGSEESAAEESNVDKLAIVEFLRAEQGVRGALGEFQVDEYECVVMFKAPGYIADVIIDRATAEFTVTEASYGLVAVMNDLHKGRDAGPAWSLIIDVVSVLTVLLSITGFVLIFYLRKMRFGGLGAALAGGVIVLAVAAYVTF
ncbi:PepSY-associated TM helix domain-containing protein [Lacipirellula sp.]|uniref:PepSY-associated TM helix domain-containing protein n=1 Tax=Lacipirellula sp. TaxID=2691419 RepID=UPI003D11904E